MRTTVEFEADTAAAIEQLRADRGMGLSEAVNELIRRGLMPRPRRDPFRQTTHAVGIGIDVSDVAEALEVLEGVDRR